jgi:hypothetical protein
MFMKNNIISLISSTFILACGVTQAAEEGFKVLFDGKSLEGWKVAENPESFKVENGAIIAKGPRAHAFFVDGKFKNFELRLEAMTKENSNGGVFIHTMYQEKGWPGKGYEVQVNNTQGDWRKTGGLYAVVDNKEPFKDNTWMEMVIRVENGVITTTVNGKELVKYKSEGEKSKLLAEGGTIALQAHDPGSEIHYKNIRIKVLE